MRALEHETHRHLEKGEIVQDGDIYGGADWEFVFMIGSPQVQLPRAGDLCDMLLGYRVRRARR